MSTVDKHDPIRRKHLVDGMSLRGDLAPAVSELRALDVFAETVLARADKQLKTWILERIGW